MYRNILLLLLCFLFSGCLSAFGPRSIKNAHPAYNQAIVSTIDEQMLLNLVRLKYRDTPYFLEVASVTTSLSIETNVGIDAIIPFSNAYNTLEPGLGFKGSTKPTITYTPLRGEDFLKSVLSPISLDAILLMTQSGWSIERVFGVCIERINDLNNASRASGPTPENEPKYKEFRILLKLLRQLQLEGLVEMGPGLDVNTKNLILLFKKNTNYENAITEVRSLLNVTQQSNQFSISTNFLDIKENQLNMRARSIISVLFYLSQNIDIPEEHKKAGLITVTKTQDGEEFNWSETPGGMLFKVMSSKQKPGNAFVSVYYRGAWFYIADNDLRSKSTFLLLKQLFSLQSGQRQYIGPSLTLPVGS
ncbi:MAG: hypothetical protein K8F52_09915 [Candidatus Scalindua rubra]|uniref:Uncharacterized protein n=1 Tax=Candidatus Scalindua brodae TaxID=237368 RepID=A0A0B0EFJ6_9BACT|nr:MAG: hypothetical protein SCABRO_02413 [Candidatus Scalindua brodae]MBZ0108974.1 hypothetical protein [Candidatus Scalindua rubra]TWU36403.1 hypothetical protein S225a_06820 [Candidatus Brocadiaceae bacterium S225]